VAFQASEIRTESGSDRIRIGSLKEDTGAYDFTILRSYDTNSIL